MSEVPEKNQRHIGIRKYKMALVGFWGSIGFAALWLLGSVYAGDPVVPAGGMATIIGVLNTPILYGITGNAVKGFAGHKKGQ